MDKVELINHRLEKVSPPVRLTRATLLKIFRLLTNKAAALANPQEFAGIAARIIRDRLGEQLVGGISYEKLNDWYEMTQFESEFESYAALLVPTTRGVYDHVVFQSEVERRFVLGLEANPAVRLYVKLPGWFKVPTPVGNYNPDWAIVTEDTDDPGASGSRPILYLVRETKGTLDEEKLQYAHERRKIAYARRHFGDALQVNYDTATNAGEILRKHAAAP